MDRPPLVAIRQSKMVFKSNSKKGTPQPNNCQSRMHL